VKTKHTTQQTEISHTTQAHPIANTSDIRHELDGSDGCLKMTVNPFGKDAGTREKQTHKSPWRSVSLVAVEASLQWTKANLANLATSETETGNGSLVPRAGLMPRKD
jgi:hypothetical protein